MSVVGDGIARRVQLSCAGSGGTVVVAVCRWCCGICQPLGARLVGGLYRPSVFAPNEIRDPGPRYGPGLAVVGCPAGPPRWCRGGVVEVEKD